MENWCHDCRSEGKDVVGKFQVDGRWKCAAHWMAWRKDHPEETPKPLSFDAPPPAPAPVPEEDPQPMKEKADYSAMQKDRDAGMRPMDIAEKYKVSYQTVFNRTTTPKVKPAPPAGKRPGRLESLADAGKDRDSFSERHRAPTHDRIKKVDAAFSKNTTIYELLAKLRSRKAAITEAIEALEMAEKVLARSEELV